MIRSKAIKVVNEGIYAVALGGGLGVGLVGRGCRCGNFFMWCKKQDYNALLKKAGFRDISQPR